MTPAKAAEIRHKLHVWFEQCDDLRALEDKLRPYVPGVSGLGGDAFFDHVWAHCRLDPRLKMDGPEYDNLPYARLLALLQAAAAPKELSGANPDGEVPEIPPDIPGEAGLPDWLVTLVKTKREEALTRRSGGAIVGAPEPPKPEPASVPPDVFAEQPARERAIKAAAKVHGPTVRAAAKWLGVDYSDLRRWARDRGCTLAKGTSGKVLRIETHLKSFA